MNTDSEDTWLAVGAGISIAVFGVCVFGTIIRKYCMIPRMKESRSDGDLASMIERGESS